MNEVRFSSTLGDSDIQAGHFEIKLCQHSALTGVNASARNFGKCCGEQPLKHAVLQFLLMYSTTPLKTQLGFLAVWGKFGEGFGEVLGE